VMVARILLHMQKKPVWMGWGVFPLWMYPPTPTTKPLWHRCSCPDAVNRSWRRDGIWYEKAGGEGVHRTGNFIPKITEVSDDITKQILRCRKTGNCTKSFHRNWVFIEKWLLHSPTGPWATAARTRGSPQPTTLINRPCASCGVVIQSILPERPEIVYCEACF
jgi:hypothetical protein